jgi:hypothetical protein
MSSPHTAHTVAIRGARWLLAMVVCVPNAQAAISTSTTAYCFDSLGGIVKTFEGAGAVSCDFQSSNVAHTASGKASVTLKAGQRSVGVTSSASASLERVYDHLPAQTVVQGRGRITLTDSLDVLAKDAYGNAIGAGFMDVDVLVHLSSAACGMSRELRRRRTAMKTKPLNTALIVGGVLAVGTAGAISLKPGWMTRPRPKCLPATAIAAVDPQVAV